MSKTINFQSLFKLTGEYTLDVYTLKFPEEIYNKFISKFINEPYKKRNMKITDLNVVMGSYLSDIYFLNFVSSSNLEDGWIFASHDEYLDLIKQHLKHWLERIKLSIEDEIIESLEFNKETITITPEDVKAENFKCRLLLAYLSRHMAANIDISVEKEEKDIIPIDIIPVNSHPRNRVLCLHPERMVTMNKKTNLYFNYYFEITSHELKGEEYPYLCIEVGTMRLATYKNIESVNNGASLSGMHPYIIMNNSLRVADGNFKLMAFRGEIGTPPRSNEYIWKRNYKGLLKDTLDVELPDVKDVLANPTNYVNNDEVSILIPHGTHLSVANHAVGSGMDFKMRSNILSILEGELTSLGLIEGSLKAEVKNGNSNLKENKNLLEGLDYLKFDLLYTNSETMIAFKKYFDCYNDINKTIQLAIDAGNASAVKKSIKKYTNNVEKGPIDNPDYEDSKSKLEFLAEFEKKCEQFEGLNLKSLKKLYGHLHKKDLANIEECVNNYKPIILNCIDYSDLDTYAIPYKNKNAKENYIDSLKNLNLSADSSVVFVELEDKEKFKGKTDPKNIIRKTLAKEFNKTTQFFVPFKTKMTENRDNKKDCEVSQAEITEHASDVITKIILEGIRQTGLVHKRKFDKDIAQVGILKHDRDFFLTAIIGDATYGKFRNSDWIPYHDLQLLIASSEDVENDELLKVYNAKFLEDSIDSLFDKFDINHAYVSVLDRNIKNIIPDMYKNNIEFNLKLNLSKEQKEFAPYLNKKVTVMIIDDTIDSEWFPFKNNENQTASFSSTLCKINDFLYISTASGRQGVMTSSIQSVMKNNKLDKLSVVDKKYFKSSPIFIYFPKVGANHNVEKVAIFTHFTKSQTAVQHYGTDSTEEIKLPISLNITKNLLEFYI